MVLLTIGLAYTGRSDIHSDKCGTCKGCSTSKVFPMQKQRSAAEVDMGLQMHFLPLFTEVSHIPCLPCNVLRFHYDQNTYVQFCGLTKVSTVSWMALSPQPARSPPSSFHRKGGLPSSRGMNLCMLHTDCCHISQGDLISIKLRRAAWTSNIGPGNMYA